MNIVTDDKIINKTVVITYDDATRMIDACNDSEHHTSKEFFDWYLSDNGKFFATTGMLLVDFILKSNQRSAVAFDFTNPDEAVFTSYVYSDQSVICSWVFRRQENLTMDDITFEIKYLSLTNLKKNDLLCPQNIKEKLHGMAEKIGAGYHRPGFRSKTVLETTSQAVNTALKDINGINCKSFTYFVYALMFYVFTREPQEITSEFREANKEVQKGKGIYKYTGYIDLRECKVYKPVIKKDPDEPTRVYMRHIQKWTVRGHYRRINGKLIWIDPHTKGEGELEKRIYSTEDEKDLNIIPKIFEVERNITVTTKQGEPVKIEQAALPVAPAVIVEQKKVSWWGKIYNYLFAKK